MDFDLSEEQRLLKDSVDGLLKASYDFETRKKYRAEKGGWSKDVWGKFAEQGLLGLPFSEDDGGFGAGPIETMIVMEALGRNLVVEPYLDTVVLGGGVLRRASAEQRAAHLPGIIDGSKTMAFAQVERDSRYDLGDIKTSAKKSGAGYTLSGEKFVVGHGDTADTLIVTARTAGGQRDAKGVGVFLVPANAKGVDIHGYETQDGSRAADIKLNNVEVGADAVIGDADNGLSLVNQVADDARIALCAEAVGAMEEALKVSVEYIKERKQFGVAIGSFQALQHRAADMFTALETARSMSFLASMASSFTDLDERAKTVAAAKVQIGRSARFVGQGGVQLHGGVGVTMEYRIGHYFKRLTMIEQQFGDADFHLRRVAQAGGITE
ncbi:pimeloyl-CoA dehydrogenase small subunit [Tardiphaga sp. P9-11]|jgi:pimeloyl-CoA dehydrogenase small subunit|uniref:pimeloyl-CoA dehydrogenase small subunit n=1 Tax=Tardiphaga sp. P9-11 TaxID=2024614 RepID=UPI0011F37075|nr:pimeloyl-CoA dehydrogenase small subunit [Tardiphaga sp. P9-11]KAA0071594.1 pimeloyl-CoA dehydrogenase small subunit [Tardiphaga sp. P9-11]